MTKRGAFALVAVGAMLVTGGSGATRPSPSSSRVPVKVFFAQGPPGTRCAAVAARRRLVRPPAVLREAMAALLRGPTDAERAHGFGGWFSARTAGRLHRVQLVEGVAYIDFRDFRRVIPGASSACGSALLLAQLDRTARQFPSVRRAVFSFDGSVRSFYEWLQRPPPALR